MMTTVHWLLYTKLEIKTNALYCLLQCNFLTQFTNYNTNIFYFITRKHEPCSKLVTLLDEKPANVDKFSET